MYFMVRRYFLCSLAIWCSIFMDGVSALCYFPDYIQGGYTMQSSSGLMSQVSYTEVNITEENVSRWGSCKEKKGNDLYLIESMTAIYYCLRCFHISLKSPNILVVRTTGNPERCYANKTQAEATCPKPDSFDVTRQMILYRTKDVKRENCPIAGKYMLRYRQNKDDNSVIECASRTSDVSNCPVGSELRVRFQDCPFESHDLTLACLGTWSGPSNQQYIAFFDMYAREDRPMYRCGLYLEDSGNGNVYMALSSDSTCRTNLQSSQSGFETFVMSPYPDPPLQRTNCRFPDWLWGRWELVTAEMDRNTFTYRDNVQFLTYTFECLRYDVSEKRYDFPLSPTADEDHKILVYGRSHCGDELYTCLWLKSRGSNVFEFQIGQRSSQIFNETLCSSAYFQQNVWITQARRDYLIDMPCPIVGEYFGKLPSAEVEMCAKLSSNCTSPDTMYYTVSDCGSDTMEDREYRCLGQWVENGRTYTFTERKHVGTFECFVGMPKSDTEIWIQEAGRHCERNSESLMGMVLTKRSSCAENRTIPVYSYPSSSETVPVTVTTTKPVIRRTSPTTKSFPVVTKGLKSSSRSKTVNTSSSTNNVPSQLLIIFLYYWCYLQ